MSGPQTVAGERTVGDMQLPRTISSRLPHVLAGGLVLAVGVGVLVWYYLHLLEQDRGVVTKRNAVVEASTRSEMKLPPLGHETRAVAGTGSGKAAAEPSEDAVETLPPPRPAAVPIAPGAVHREQDMTGAIESAGTGSAAPVLVRPAVGGGGTGVAPAVPDDALAEEIGDAGHPGRHAPPTLTEREQRAGAVAPILATVVPTRRWLLAKGSFLDCTLETAIDSTLAGLSSCVLATDVYGADGSVVLLERGTKLFGEVRGEIRAGQVRVAVVWSEARTPTGVVVALNAPGGDALGRAGVPGAVDRHLSERFGAAVLLTVLDAAVNAAGSRGQGAGVVVYRSQGAQDVATEALRGSIAIPPTIRVPPGARIAVTVARDVDFRGVYRLQAHGQS